MQLTVILSFGLILAVLVNTFGLVSGKTYIEEVNVPAKPGKVLVKKIRFPKTGFTDEIMEFHIIDESKTVQNYTITGGGKKFKFIEFVVKSYVGQRLHFLYEVETRKW